MNKWMIIGILGLLISSSISVSAVIEKQKDMVLTDTILFSPPSITKSDETCNIVCHETNAYTNTPGEYFLPYRSIVYTLPFGSKITELDVQFNLEEIIYLPLPLATISSPRVDGNAMTHEFPKYAFPKKTTDVGIHPGFLYNHHVVTGRYEGEFATLLILELFPIQYNSEQQKVTLYTAIDVQISYVLGKQPQSFADAYDLLVIVPEEFSSVIQPLVDHKIAHGIATKMVTLTDIYHSIYFPVQGRDCAEEIKYFIKSALDEWGISYVLLVGGRKGGVMQETWWVPVRYSHLNDGGENSYLTDLYFADIYDASMNFSSWDSNENDIFAEWTGSQKDIIDMFPEVYIGRLACRNTYEVTTLVKKIITYETTAYGSEWATKYVGVSGDTYPDPGDPLYEGELATQASFNHLSGYTASFLWTSDTTFSDKTDVLREINKGCGFIHFSGHGSPAAWGNHPPNSNKFIYGPNNLEVIGLHNLGKNPIIIVGGCHNAQFNVSLLNIIKGIVTEGLDYFSPKNPVGSFWHDEWVPRCWGWSLVNRRLGGGIAVIANTGLGYGASGINWNQSRGRVMEMLFFEKFSDGHDILGAAHGQDIMAYMTRFPPMDDMIDCKIAQQWILLGDPSLKIGGYAS
ncbi:MAG: hypothetical protein KKG04_02925 [Candidatus Thermoplasmatota archaeon]|nr:hypothetical protein [Candidatus Thermoplasmatota archaeon]